MKNKYLFDEHCSLWLFFSLAIIYALVYMTKNCFSAAMAFLVEENVLTKSQTGTISAVFYIVYAPFQIAGGFAADKYSPFKLISIGLIGATIANILILLKPTYYFMMAMWGFNGLVQFGVWPSVFKITSTMLAPVHRRKAIFYIFMSSSVGLVISYVLAGAVSGWKANFIIAAVTLFICSVYWLIAGGIFNGKMVCEVETVLEEHRIPTIVKSSEKVKLMPLFIKSGMVFLLPIAVTQSVLSIGIQALTPSMITESYESVSVSVASVLTVIPVIVSVAGKMLMNCLYGKMHHTETSVITVCFLILMPVLAMFMLMGRVNVVFIVMIISVCLLVSNGISILISSHVNSRFTIFGKDGTLSGVINCMASLGIIFTNLVSTRIADAFGWNAVILSWILLALFSAVLGVLAYFPWKRFIKTL